MISLLRARFRIVKAKVGVFLMQRAARKNPNLFDKCCGRLLSWTAEPNEESFMDDELVDQDIEFDVEELNQLEVETAEVEHKDRQKN